MMIKYKYLAITLGVVFLLFSLLLCATYSSFSATKTATGTISIQKPAPSVSVSVSSNIEANVNCSNTWRSWSSSVTSGVKATVKGESGYWRLRFRYYKPILYEYNASTYNASKFYGGTYNGIQISQKQEIISSQYGNDGTGYDTYFCIKYRIILNDGDSFSISTMFQEMFAGINGDSAVYGSYDTTKYCEDIALYFGYEEDYNAVEDSGYLIKEFTQDEMKIYFSGNSTSTKY